jgi:hypothetical protein
MKRVSWRFPVEGFEMGWVRIARFESHWDTRDLPARTDISLRKFCARHRQQVRPAHPHA